MTNCEKMSTLCPSRASLGRSLSRSTIFPEMATIDFIWYLSSTRWFRLSEGPVPAWATGAAADAAAAALDAAAAAAAAEADAVGAGAHPGFFFLSASSSAIGRPVPPLRMSSKPSSKPPLKPTLSPTLKLLL